MEIKRFSHEKEMDVMHPETNRRNVKFFKEILPLFYYNDKTNKNITGAINPMTRDYKFSYVNQLLNLNSQDRAWYEVNGVWHLDKAYKKFQNWLSKAASELQRIGIMPDAITYDQFKENKLIVKKNTYKLIKYMTKHNLMSQSEAEDITTAKAKDNLYLCVSRNPIDMLFCSTNQPFSSCLSLNSTHSAAYYMGCGALAADPNRAIIFLTNGKLRKYVIDHHEFKHFAYMSRAWIILMRRNNWLVDKIYPHQVLDFDRLLNSIGQKTFRSDRKITSQFNFELPYNQENKRNFVYLDNILLSINQKTGKALYDTYRGCTGARFACSYDWDNGFHSIDDFEDLYSGVNTTICGVCGDREQIEAMFHLETVDQCLCDRCYDIHGFYCESCNRYFYKDDGQYVDYTEEWVCCDCLSNNFTECDNCQEYFPDDHITEITVQHQRHNTANINIYSITLNYCEDCIDKVTSDCTLCKERFHSDDLVDGLCEDCEQFIETTEEALSENNSTADSSNKDLHRRAA